MGSGIACGTGGSPRRRLAAGAALLLLLAGCGAGEGDGDPGVDPGATDSPSGTSATPSADPSTEPSATVEPATGPLLTSQTARLRLPEGWTVHDGMTDLLVMGVHLATAQTIGLFDSPMLGGYTAGITLDQLAESTLKREPGLRRLPDLLLDGLPAVHLVGRNPDSPQQQRHRIILRRDDRDISLKFDLARKRSPGQVVESVLATFEWRA